MASAQVVPLRVAAKVHGHVAAHRIDFQLLPARPAQGVLDQCRSDASTFERSGNARVGDVHAPGAEPVVELAAQALDDGFESALFRLVLDVDVG